MLWRMALTPDDITAEMLLNAYCNGVFPMARTRDSAEIMWMHPQHRGILPLDGFHLSRRLYRTVKAGKFEISCDRDFDAVIAGCAAPGPDRDNTWINAWIVRTYRELFDVGFVHTVECRLDGQLVGGLYGVHIGSVVFGESMFSVVTDASKVALVHLVARLRLGGFSLLDTQWITAHLSQFGAIEIPRRQYERQLDAAIRVKAIFPTDPGEAALAEEFAVLAGR